jgi:hypothetical protein
VSKKELANKIFSRISEVDLQIPPMMAVDLIV